MEKTTLRRLVGAAMVGIGLVQAATGAVRDDLVFAALGLAYALIGGAYLYFEGFADNR